MDRILKLRKNLKDKKLRVKFYYVFIELFFCFIVRNIFWLFTSKKNPVCVNGYRMNISPPFYGCKKDLMQFKKREFKSTDFFTDYLKQQGGGLKVVEIGANIGYYALLELYYGNRVFCFEPDKKNMVELEGNIVLNGFKDYKLFPVGIGNVNGRLKFNIAKECNLSTFVDVDSGKGSSLVDVRKLDSFGFEDVDVIRMDIEGYELDALKGAKDTLSRMSSGGLVFVEVHNLVSPSLFDSVNGFLESNGFVLVNKIVEGTEFPFFNYMNWRRLFNMEGEFDYGCIECFYRRV